MALDGSRAEFYRQRATAVRGIAEKCRDPDIKDQFETVAKEYEALALSVDKGVLSH
jgi:hypothetical protein